VAPQHDLRWPFQAQAGVDKSRPVGLAALTSTALHVLARLHLPEYRAQVRERGRPADRISRKAGAS